MLHEHPGFESNFEPLQVHSLSANPPEVTVVMPVFNREWCIARAVESVMSIDSHSVELLVIDDGSTDQTPEILDRLLGIYSHRMRVLRHANGSNRGISASRNLGLSVSRASLVAFLDSDDCYFKHRFASAIAWMHDHPKIMIGLEPYEIAERGSCRFEPHLTTLAVDQDGRIDALDALLNQQMTWTTPVVTARADALRILGGFDTRFRVGEDTALWLRFAATRSVGIIGTERAVAVVNRHENHSWSALEESKGWLVYLHALTDAFNWAKRQSDLVDEAATRALGNRLRSYLVETIRKIQANKRLLLSSWWKTLQQTPELILDRPINTNLLLALAGRKVQ